MRKLIYLPLATIAILIVTSSCSTDGNSKVMRVSERNFSDLKVYVGRPSGGIELDLETAFSETPLSTEKIDSLQQALGRKHFSPLYDQFGTHYSQTTIEFYDKRLSYINRNINGIQIIAPYFFQHNNGKDSLFAETTDGTPLFVAEGASETDLWRTVGFIKYPKTGLADWELNADTTKQVDINKALELTYFNSLSAMTDNRDTIVICNLKYIYK